MNRDEHPLDQFELQRLEGAAKELNEHVRRRRRALRPSTTRRVIGLLFSIPAFLGGAALLYWSILTGHLIGLPALIGPALMVGSGMWIYSDWIE